MEHIKKTLAWDSAVFFKAPDAIWRARQNVRLQWLRTPPSQEAITLYERYTEHDWFFDLRGRFSLHPVVEHLVKAYRPNDWQQLLLEHPHASESDPNRLAYTRDEAAGKADRQTITSVGKYIKRHWPALPDHVLRDAAALYVPDRVEHGTGIVV